MFDIGFWEMVFISVIGLVVLGPERLPPAIRSVVRWVNTAKGMANSVKTEISQELKLHEINENMVKASKLGLNDLDPELKDSIDDMKKTAQKITRPYQASNEDLNSLVAEKSVNTVKTDENSIINKSAASITPDKSE
ncbi:Sec-independent protein translocase protein TatB [Psychromonas ossibalaenae]|uniref:Sec-independent protein translocase protein TatB n=1 Tax=Psychromonas ossibalaenae TaxID=444922 RepID=UPI0003802A9F|nr:Sec-independent protein translocase protein TatB [Psychromonas ossibalaenae]